MRKTIASLLAIVVLGGALVAPASAGKKKKAKPKPQVVEGSILVPQGGGPAATCVYRAQRTLMIAGGPNEILGYTFDVDPKTAGRPFKLEVSDGAGVDISFYMDLGDPTDPTTAPANQPYETTGPGGEEGVVPEGFPIAFVCLTDGANATFKYSTS
ncbi:MAG: hypothetical protein ACLGIB_10580 [Actinomycetota bacterium]